MLKDTKSLFILSDVNLDFLAKNLQLENFELLNEISCSEFNSYKKIFLTGEGNYKFNNYEYLFLWQSPEAVSEAFISLKNFEFFNEQSFFEDIEFYVNRIKHMATKFEIILLPTLNPFDELSDIGIGKMNKSVGYNYFIHMANSIIIKELSDIKNIYLIDSGSWFQKSNTPFDYKLWLRAKMPFSIDFIKVLTKDLISSIKTILGIQKKLIVLDLDNTIWGGIVGDDGWENIKIGGHDVIGEAYLAFQKELKNLSNRGVLLSICSKNEESIVREAFKKNKYMHLTLDDFCSFQVNWDKKAMNILNIARETNLGLDSFIFIDDSPYERDSVKRELPDVQVPNFPDDVTLLPIWLNSLDFFNVLEYGKEDKNRNISMKIENKKNLLKLESASLDDWIESLNLKIKISQIEIADFQRCIQLINKTNQMNLYTNRYIEKQFEEILSNPDYIYLKVSIEDKFSSNELMGVIGLDISRDKIVIKDFILSCRAFGKNVENTMIEAIKIIAKKFNRHIEQPKIVKTEKNIVCQTFFKDINLKKEFVYTNKNDHIYINELRTHLILHDEH